jgi:uncharacterized protein with HEPN domain
MRPNEDEIEALWDMKRAIEEIQGFMVGFSEDSYLETLWLQRVVERNFEILGEAARHISREFQQANPEIDWRNTIGLRNIIAHRYSQVDHEILWSVVNDILPEILQQVSQWLLMDSDGVEDD